MDMSVNTSGTHVPTLYEIKAYLPIGDQSVRVIEKPISGIVDDSQDKFATWEAAFAAGKSYLVGSEMPNAEFVRHHLVPLRPWMKAAYHWAKANPGKYLVITIKTSFRPGNADYIWHVGLRGEYVEFDVEFDLPYQDGGERGWICQNGKTMVQVNQD
jgi:hypothetical protein